MKENITKENVLRLREEFVQYTKRAEQHEYVKLTMIHIKLNNSIANFDSMDNKEKNAMFRVVYQVMGKDNSEYESNSNSN